MITDKPNGAKAGWHALESTSRFQNEIFRLREDEIDLRGQEKIRFTYLERGEAVIVVPVTRAGEMVLINQYRYPVDEWCLEVPAGGMHDTGDASPEEVAREELHEEIGATCGALTYVNFFFSANSMTSEKCHVFLAEDVQLGDQPEKEPAETMETRLVSVLEALGLARTGGMKTGPCALAVLWCEPLLAARGYLGLGVE